MYALYKAQIPWSLWNIFPMHILLLFFLPQYVYIRLNFSFHHNIVQIPKDVQHILDKHQLKKMKFCISLYIKTGNIDMLKSKCQNDEFVREHFYITWSRLGGGWLDRATFFDDEYDEVVVVHKNLFFWWRSMILCFLLLENNKVVSQFDDFIWRGGHAA